MITVPRCLTAAAVVWATVLLAVWWRASKPPVTATAAGDTLWDDDVDSGAE